MKHNKLFLLVIVLLLAAMALSACGGGEERKPQSRPAQEAAEQAEEPMAAPTEAPMEEPTEAPMEEPTEEPMEEPTEEPMEEPAKPAETTATLVILADETTGPILESFIPDYAAAAGIEVIVESVAFDDIGERVRNAIPAGEGPDIFISAHDQIGNYIEGGLIAPVDISSVRDNIMDSAVGCLHLQQ